LNRTMKKITINIIVLLILLYGIKSCHHYIFFGKKNLLRSKLLDNNVFEEKFKSFSGGVLMSNTYTYYVTDSITFRKYLGDCDDKEFFRCHVKGDSLVVLKTSWRNSSFEKTINTSYFSIDKLKKEGDFE
jgi:hypothetical protein